MIKFPEGFGESTGGRYLNSLPDKIKLRIITEPVFGTEFWVSAEEGDKPKRVPIGTTVPVGEVILDKYGNPNMGQWMGVAVYNYDEKSVQIWNVKQKSIIRGLKKLATDEDWGDWRKYDITVERAEDGRSYSVTPARKDSLSSEEKEMIKNIKEKIKLEHLFISKDHPFGGDPFEEAVQTEVEEQTINPDDLPF